MLGLGSIKYPLISSIGGAIYLLGRLAYFQVDGYEFILDYIYDSFFVFKGYSSGQPEKRQYGAFGYIGFFAMMGCAIKTVYDLVRA